MGVDLKMRVAVGWGSPFKIRTLPSPHRCRITSFSQLKRISQSGQDKFFVLSFLSHLKLL